MHENLSVSHKIIILLCYIMSLLCYMSLLQILIILLIKNKVTVTNIKTAGEQSIKKY